MAIENITHVQQPLTQLQVDKLESLKNVNPTRVFEGANLTIGQSNSGLGYVDSNRFNFEPKLEKPVSGSFSAKEFDAKLDSSVQSTEVDIFALMESIFKLGQEQKKISRQIRFMEYEDKWQSLESAAAQVKEAAGKEFAASLIQGAMQIGGASFSAGFSLVSTSQTSKLMKSLNDRDLNFNEFQMEQLVFQGKLQTLQNKSNLGQTFNELGQGLSSIGSAPLNYGAKLDEEDQKYFEALNEKISSRIEALKEYIDSIKELLDNVRNKLSAIEQSRYDTNTKIFS